jgi:hypothetical protein
MVDFVTDEPKMANSDSTDSLALVVAFEMRFLNHRIHKRAGLTGIDSDL